MKRYIFSFIIVVFIAFLLMQCERNDGSKEPQWTTYTTADGLASNYVHAIAIDAEGNKWFGTSSYWDGEKRIGGGISKFNGTNWTTYDTLDGLASNDVRSIAIDAEGNKWFGCVPDWDSEQNVDIGGGVSKLSGD